MGARLLLHYDATTRQITAYDGREAAPAGATPDMFLDAQGQPLPFADAVTSGRSTGVPESALIHVAVRTLGLSEVKPFDARAAIIEARLASPARSCTA